MIDEHSQLQKDSVASWGLPEKTIIQIKNVQIPVSTSGTAIFTNIHEVVKTGKANSIICELFVSLQVRSALTYTDKCLQ